MFLLNFVSAEIFSFDNKVYYDNFDKDVQIKNLFGAGKHYANLKITSHEDLDKPIYVGTGWQRVITQEIDSKEDYNNFIGNVEFRNMKNGGSDNLEYYWEKAIYGNVEVNDYKTECKTINALNGTSYGDCKQVLNGTYTRNQIVKWEKFEEYNIRKDEKITLALVVNVKKGDYYDGIPTFFGKEIKEWASWSSDLTNGIITYYQFNQSSGTTAPEYFNGTYNITGLSTNNWTTGKIGGGYQPYYETSDAGFDFNGLSSVTVNHWVQRVGEISGDGPIVNTYDSNDNGLITTSVHGTDKWNARAWDDTTARDSTLLTLPLNEWQMFTVIWNSSSMLIYQNGTYKETIALSNFVFNSRNLEFGGAWYRDKVRNTNVDELGIWQRALSSSEITDLYNSGDGITPSEAEVPSISINITYPTATTYTTDTHNLTYTFTNNSLTDSCWYSLDLGATNSSRVNCGTNWTSLSASEGSNTWTVYGNLTDGTLGNTTVTFTVDSITPEINITSPLNSTQFTTTSVDIEYTYNDTNMDSCYWSNDTGTNNHTLASCGTNITGIDWDEGRNTIYIYGNDTFGNINTSESVTFDIDSIDPFVNIVYPANDSTFTSGNIDVNVTMTDLNLQTCWWTNNTGETNYTFTCGTNLTTNIWEFSNVVYMYANDSFGNENSSVVSFTWLPFDEQNQTFEPTIYETNSSLFRLNISSTTGDNIQSAIFNYNGTNYTSPTITEKTGSNYTITKSINIIPRDTNFISENREFFWFLTLVNEDSGVTSDFETDHYNQTVKELFFEKCGLNANITILNFTMKDQYDNSIINASKNATTFQASFSFGLDSSYRVKNYSISNLSVDKSEFAFCINDSYNKVYTDMNSFYTAVDYSESNYYLSNSLLSNITTNINLFLLRESDSLEFFITAEEDLRPIDYATVNVQKYFVGEGLYKTVEIDETDASGDFTSYLDLDAEYRFTIIKDSVVLGVVDKKAICQAAPCTLTLSLLSDSTDIFEGYRDSFAQDVQYNLSYNHSSNLVNFQFVDTTGTATYFRLLIFESSGNETSKQIFDKKLYTSAGQILWDSSNYSDGNFRAEAYISRSPDKFIDFITFVLSETAEELGIVGLFTAFLLLVIVIFGISFKPSMFIMTVPLAITLFKILGLAYLSNTVVIIIYIMAIALTALLSR